jgi:hypothetical protein
VRTLYRCSSQDDDADKGRGRREEPSRGRNLDDLPYRIELWDTDKKAIEQILAITASGSIGYAAYHAATVEYPDRYIVLRHRDAILSRFNGPSH